MLISNLRLNWEIEPKTHLNAEYLQPSFNYVFESLKKNQLCLNSGTTSQNKTNHDFKKVIGVDTQVKLGLH